MIYLRASEVGFESAAAVVDYNLHTKIPTIFTLDNSDKLWTLWNNFHVQKNRGHEKLILIMSIIPARHSFLLAQLVTEYCFSLAN
jgi:hypothetical protein